MRQVRLVDDGALRPLIFLSRFPDVEIQRYSALALAGLALGGHGGNKTRIVDEGSMRPLVDLMRFPDRDVQLASVLAVNSIVLGLEQNTKAAVMVEKGLEPILDLLRREDLLAGPLGRDDEMLSSCIYALGSLAENDDVKTRLVELGTIGTVVKHLYLGNIEIKRAAGYFLATVCERIEFHGDLAEQGALDAAIMLASLEDIECQEYASFSLAHLSSNKELQVRLVNLGAVKPLVSLIASDQEPKHYAGLALLKLADNFENHLRIAEDGGIQALLRLGRTRSTDDQLQYKAALTVGHLASNAVRILPTEASPAAGGMITASATGGEPLIGHGSRVLGRLRGQVDAQKARSRTMEYLDQSLDMTKRNAELEGGGGAAAGPGGRQSITQTALSIGLPPVAGSRPSSSEGPIAGGVGEKPAGRTVGFESTTKTT